MSEISGNGRNTGIRTGLNKSQFWQALLDNQFDSKLTDDQLRAAINLEFPESDTEINNTFIRMVRNRYNRGQLSCQGRVAPVVPVPRFLEDGKVFIPKRGPPPRYQDQNPKEYMNKNYKGKRGGDKSEGSAEG